MREPAGIEREDPVFGDTEVGLEEEVVDAEVWLDGCRAARTRGEPSHAVGAGPIGDPGLVEIVERLRVGVDGLVSLMRRVVTGRICWRLWSSCGGSRSGWLARSPM